MQNAAVPLNISILSEDSQVCDRLADRLRRSGYEVNSVSAEPLDPNLSVILAQLPAVAEVVRGRIQGILHDLRERGLSTPLIVIAHPDQEELALACLEWGAADYLCMDRLGRLGAAVGQALERVRAGQAEQALTESEERYRRLVEMAPVGIAVHSEGKIIFINPYISRLIGARSPDEVIGHPVMDFVPIESLKAITQRLQTMNNGEAVSALEEKIVCLDGSVLDAEIIAAPVVYQGKPAIQLIGQDIRGRKTAQKALRESEERYRRLFENAVLGLFQSTPEGGVIAVNKAFARMFGYSSPEDVLATVKNVSTDIFADPNRRAEIAKQAAQHPELTTFENIYRRKDGSTFPGTLNLHPVKDSSGRLLYFEGMIEDITRRKADERDLARRMSELESLAEISAVVRAAETREEMLPAVLDRMQKVLGVDGSAIAIRDQRSGELVFELGRGSWVSVQGIRIPPEKGIGGAVVSSRQAIYVNQEDCCDPRMFSPNLIGSTKYVLCLPLITREQVTGLLYLGRQTTFLPADIRMAEATADIIASAFHRVYLYQQTILQLQRLNALRAIDQSILSTPDLEKTLQILLEMFTGLLGVDGVDILLYQPNPPRLVLAAERGLPATPIWDAGLPLKATHAGQAALSRQMEFIPDLSQVDDLLTRKIRAVGESFTSYLTMPLLAMGELKGVTQIFNRSRLDPTPDWFDFLRSLTSQAAIAIDHAQLFKEQQETNQRLTLAYDDTIAGWSRALDLRDEETEGHSRRVTDLTLALAERLGVPPADLPHLRRGAQLHDIGKMGIPDSILLKAGPLTDEEWVIMRKHPVYALDFLSPIDFLQPALAIPYCHHEKWDGSGYPRGLKGEQIPLPARIFTVVDVWDALTSDRPYRPAWSSEKALAYIREQAGRHFDPRVAERFLELLEEEEWI